MSGFAPGLDLGAFPGHACRCEANRSARAAARRPSRQVLPLLQEQAVPEVAVLPRCSGLKDSVRHCRPWLAACAQRQPTLQGTGWTGDCGG